MKHWFTGTAVSENVAYTMPTPFPPRTSDRGKLGLNPRFLLIIEIVGGMANATPWNSKFICSKQCN